MTCTKRLLALILAGGLAACNEPTRPSMLRNRPNFAISDAVHEGGTAGFYFLSPMVAQPTFGGTFDADIATLNPAIGICDITNGPDVNCGSAGGTSAVAVFTTTSTPAITVDLTTPQYQVNWDTRAAGFVASHTYRVHVTAGASGARRELGFADVLLTTTPGQVKNVATGDLIVLKDGRPLPLHFRIETGIVGSVGVSAASASVATGGTDVVTATVRDLHGVPLGSATVTWTALAAAGVVASLAPASSLTNGSGQATTLLTAGATPGSAVVTGTSAGVSATATVAVTGGGAGKPLYVANQGGASVTVYAPGASGDATPTTTIAGSNTGLNGPFAVPYGVAHDAVGNIYVTMGSGNSIVVFAAGASGNATPMATIAGGNTGLNFPTRIALDAAGNIYVANFGANNILVFPAGASGNATPMATIAGASTGAPIGIALDGAGKIYVSNWGGNSILIFAPVSSGNATPIATIAGDNTGLSVGSPHGIAVDGAGNIYVTNPGTQSIIVYAAGASGNATPIATIAGDNTGLVGGPYGIAVDDSGNIYVSNIVTVNNILVFAAGANGNATPTATIFGGNTGLNDPFGITF